MVDEHFTEIRTTHLCYDAMNKPKCCISSKELQDMGGATTRSTRSTGSNAFSLVSLPKHCTPAKMNENPIAATKERKVADSKRSFNVNLELAFCANTVVKNIRQNTRAGKEIQRCCAAETNMQSRLCFYSLEQGPCILIEPTLDTDRSNEIFSAAQLPSKQPSN